MTSAPQLRPMPIASGGSPVWADPRSSGRAPADLRLLWYIGIPRLLVQCFHQHSNHLIKHWLHAIATIWVYFERFVVGVEEFDMPAELQGPDLEGETYLL